MPDDGVSDDHSVTLRVEISKTGGGEVLVRGLDRFFRCCTQGPWFPGTRVKDIWEDRVQGARGLCRETHGIEVVGVLAAGCILTPDLWASAWDVSSVALHSQNLLPKQIVDLSLHGLQLRTGAQIRH